MNERKGVNMPKRWFFAKNIATGEVSIFGFEPQDFRERGLVTRPRVGSVIPFVDVEEEWRIVEFLRGRRESDMEAVDIFSRQLTNDYLNDLILWIMQRASFHARADP